MTELVTQERLKQLLRCLRRPGASIGACRIEVSAAEPRQGRLVAKGTFVYASMDGPISPIGSPGSTCTASIRSEPSIIAMETAATIASRSCDNLSALKTIAGYKGVYQIGSGKFRAKIKWYDIHIGTYRTAKEAARNYD